jgi:hypothetical protein
VPESGSSAGSGETELTSSPHYAGLYSNGSNAPRPYRADLAARVAPLLAAHGLAGADAPGREVGRTVVQAASTTVRDLDPPVLF